MTPSGITQIDGLLAGDPSPLGPANSGLETVGLLQDLLIGHGFTRLPGVFGTARGRFGPETAAAITSFQTREGLAVTGTVDVATLQRLIATPSQNPICSQGYLTLVLDVLISGLTRVMTATTQFESGGRFASINANTDHAGLSYGIIQWAQKPGRLHDLLVALETAAPAVFVASLGGGDIDVSNGLIAHTASRNGGVTDSGDTTDPNFDLVHEPWKSRFADAGLRPEFQRVQVDAALAAFTQSFAKLQSVVPGIRSERAVGFLLDVANQHGDNGLRSILQRVNAPALSESDLLVAVEQESIARVRAQFGDNSNELRSTQSRRDAFRTSPALADDPLVLA
jgi:hypothetical protein